jgi:hypothetical protein
MSQRAVPATIAQPMFPDGDRNVDRCTVETDGRLFAVVDVVEVGEPFVLVRVALVPVVLDNVVELAVFGGADVEVGGSERVRVTTVVDEPHAASVAAASRAITPERNTAGAYISGRSVALE